MTNLQKLESSNTFTEYAEKVHEKKISRLAKQVLWPQILCGWAARLAMALACWPGESFNHTAAAQHNGSKSFIKSLFDFQLFYPTVSNHYIAICDCLSFRNVFMIILWFQIFKCEFWILSAPLWLPLNCTQGQSIETNCRSSILGLVCSAQLRYHLKTSYDRVGRGMLADLLSI